ncbi:MAG: hypothetical protein ACE15C_01360 [Phycisphaerae bacterium]
MNMWLLRTAVAAAFFGVMRDFWDLWTQVYNLKDEMRFVVRDVTIALGLIVLWTAMEVGFLLHCSKRRR